MVGFNVEIIYFYSSFNDSHPECFLSNWLFLKKKNLVLIVVAIVIVLIRSLTSMLTLPHM